MGAWSINVCVNGRSRGWQTTFQSGWRSAVGDYEGKVMDGGVKDAQDSVQKANFAELEASKMKDSVY